MDVGIRSEGFLDFLMRISLSANEQSKLINGKYMGIGVL